MLVVVVFLHGLSKLVVFRSMCLDSDLAVLIDLNRREDTGAGQIKIASELLT